jgi:ectoine hydroxylase-related dioxygenase (phytanoyl-CoA dioxygenase family)
MTVLDLSTKHEPVSDFFRTPTKAEDWDRYRLTNDQVAFFHENGYLAGVQILDDDQVEILRGELAKFVEPEFPGKKLFYEYHSNESTDPSRVLFHALGSWRISPGFHDILWHPAFVVAASQLLGGPVRFWHDQLFCKPSHHGGVVAWHQDYSYWVRTIPMQHLTCWIGLDDATVDNGCLQYVPKSHRWNLLPRTDLAGNMDAIKTVLSEEQLQEFKPVPIELKKGQCAFHHPLLLHGSYENSTDRQRRAVVLNVVKDGTVSDTDEELLQQVPIIKKGERLSGQFFPLLYDPDHASR